MVIDAGSMVANLILIEEHLQLSHTDPQIRLVVLIRDIPSQGTKFPPLLHQSMEETEPKEQLLPVILNDDSKSSL